MATKLISTASKEGENQTYTLLIVLYLYSAAFLFILVDGWKELFASSGMLSYVFAIPLALLAWALAKFIGMDGRGLRRHLPIFAFLLILSAAGVFNFLMKRLEAPNIFSGAVESSLADFRALRDTRIRLDNEARDLMSSEARLEVLRQSSPYQDFYLNAQYRMNLCTVRKDEFVEEVKNIGNAGFGPVATSKLDALVNDCFEGDPPQLPAAGVKPNWQQTAQLWDETLIARIDELPFKQTLNGIDLDLIRFNTSVDRSLASLQNYLGETASTNEVMGSGRTELIGLNNDYQQNRDILIRYYRNIDELDLAPQLNLGALRQLGQWSQIFQLIFERISFISTWVYLSLGVFLDFLLVYLFNAYRKQKSGETLTRITTPAPVKHLAVN